MVLKVEDLRIGNIVTYRNPDFETTHPDCIITLDELRGIEYDGLAFEPTPLTEDWLLRFGFDLEGNEDDIKDAYFGTNPLTENYLLILTNTSGTWFYMNGYFPIFYVHQLQNLYHSLTGKEFAFDI